MPLFYKKDCIFHIKNIWKIMKILVISFYWWIEKIFNIIHKYWNIIIVFSSFKDFKIYEAIIQMSHWYICLFSFVHIEMVFKVAFCRESFCTIISIEWGFSNMYQSIHFQVTMLRKASLANVTLKWLSSCVCIGILL